MNTHIYTSAIFDIRVGLPANAVADVFTGAVLIIGFDGMDGRDVIFVDAGEPTLNNRTEWATQTPPLEAMQ